MFCYLIPKQRFHFKIRQQFSFWNTLQIILKRCQWGNFVKKLQKSYISMQTYWSIPMDKYTILYLMLLFPFVNIAGSNVYPLLPPHFLLPPNYVKHRTWLPDYMMPCYGESIRKSKQINMQQVPTLSATCQTFSLHIRFLTFVRDLQNS